MVEINNFSKYNIPVKKTKRLVDRFFRYYKQNNWDISIAIVNDQQIKRINRQYRGYNKSTDVLSFDFGTINNRRQGEIIINLNEVRKKDNYKDIFKHFVAYEYLFNFILIHGLLHLIGYDDKVEEDRIIMIDLGKQFLDKEKI